MNQRTRKFYGIFLVLLSLFVYAALITGIYMNFLGGADWWLLLIFFAIGGTLWFFPAAFILRWMAKPD